MTAWSIMGDVALTPVVLANRQLLAIPSQVSLMVTLVTGLLRFLDCLKDAFQRAACRKVVTVAGLGRGSSWLIAHKVTTILDLVWTEGILLL